jgi:hypothetical protein
MFLTPQLYQERTKLPYQSQRLASARAPRKVASPATTSSTVDSRGRREREETERSRVRQPSMVDRAVGNREHRSDEPTSGPREGRPKKDSWGSGDSQGGLRGVDLLSEGSRRRSATARRWVEERR